MIEIVTDNGVSLDLGVDTRITWIRQNPFWRDDIEFQTEVSLPFTIPNTPINSKALGWVEDYQINGVSKSIGATVKFAGNDFFPGKLVILDADSEKYTVGCTYQIVTKDMDLMIDELDYAVPFSGAAPVIADLNTIPTLPYPSANFALPEVATLNKFFMDRFAREKSLTFMHINYWNVGTDSFEKYTVPIPMVYLQYVMDVIASKINITKITGSFKCEVFGKQLIIYNPINLVTSSDSLDIYNEELEEIVYTNQGTRAQTWVRVVTGKVIINLLDPITGAPAPFSVPVGTQIDMDFNIYFGTSGFVHSVSHTVILADVATGALSLIAALNVTILASSASLSLKNADFTGAGINTVFAQYLWTGAVQTLGPIDITVDFGASILNYNPIDLRKHLPNISIGSAFDILKEWFCLTFNYDVRRNQLDISPKKDLLDEEEEDYTNYLNGKMSVVINDQQNYKITWNNDDADTNAVNIIGGNKINTFTDANGAPVNDIGIEGGTLAVSERLNGAGNVTVPTVDQPSYYYVDNNKDFKFRLLQNTGLKSIIGGNYPDAEAIQIRPAGAVQSYWEPYLDLVNASLKQFQGDFNLSYTQLINFNPKKKWRIGSNVFIWKEIRTEMTMTGIEDSRVILKKI